MEFSIIAVDFTVQESRTGLTIRYSFVHAEISTEVLTLRKSSCILLVVHILFKLLSGSILHVGISSEMLCEPAIIVLLHTRQRGIGYLAVSELLRKVHQFWSAK